MDATRAATIERRLGVQERCLRDVIDATTGDSEGLWAFLTELDYRVRFIMESVRLTKRVRLPIADAQGNDMQTVSVTLRDLYLENRERFIAKVDADAQAEAARTATPEPPTPASTGPSDDPTVRATGDDFTIVSS